MSTERAIKKHKELMQKRGYKKSIIYLGYDIRKWFFDKDINGFIPEVQADKIIEEANEVKEALLSGNELELMLEIGDVFVTLEGLCAMKDIDLRDCVDLAYDKIKDRKGTMVNGSFKKDKIHEGE